MFIQITRRRISVSSVLARMLRPQNGAVVILLGTARNQSHGKRVRALEYEAYPPMALKKMREIAREIQKRWRTEDVAIIHRLGHLKLKEISVAVAVATPHRKEAFEACRYGIDRLKQIVPVWKKEIWIRGKPTWSLGKGKEKG